MAERRGPGRLLRDARGSAAVWSVLVAVLLTMLGGAALDVTNAFRVRNQLQAAADAAALAAAARIADPDAAREVALRLAAINLPEALHGVAVGAEDVRFGAWDPATGEFAEGATPARAVLVAAAQRAETGNAVRTYLLPLVGIGSWDVAAQSVAVARTQPAPPPEPGPCAGAALLAGGALALGGGGTYRDGVCLHGEGSVSTEGQDLFSPDARVSAPELERIQLGYLREGSASAEAVSEALSLPPAVAPRLAELFETLWTEFGAEGAAYAGDAAPAFVRGADGVATVIRVDEGWWRMTAADLQPNAIYLVEHDMEIAGDAAPRNVAILARGRIAVEGGGAAPLTGVLIFARGEVEAVGDVRWGDPDAACATGRFGVYLLSLDAVELGGWGSGAGLHGALVAAPAVDAGGALRRATAVHVEAGGDLRGGDGADVGGCGRGLADELGLGVNPPPEAAEPIVVGSFLVR